MELRIEIEITVKESSSSSFYLPNNTTVYTFAWVRFRRAGQQGPIRTLTAALKRSIKTPYELQHTQNLAHFAQPLEIQMLKSF